MAITDRTRKILWGRSGNLCAVCRRTLVEDCTLHDAESVVGDECHIVGEKPIAARGAFGVGRTDLDEYDNLVLLCKVHHKLVDDQPDTYPVEKLRELKHAHELWVKKQLARKQGSVPQFTLLLRIRTGKELANVIGGSHAYQFDHEEMETLEEANLVADFLGNLQDWGNIWESLESGERVKASFSLATMIKELEESGLLIFGSRERRKMQMQMSKEIFDWEVATVAVVRAGNPGITELGDLASLIAGSDKSTRESEPN